MKTKFCIPRQLFCCAYFLSLSDPRHELMLPPLTTLSKEKQKNLLNDLKKVGFYPERKAA